MIHPGHKRRGGAFSKRARRAPRCLLSLALLFMLIGLFHTPAYARPEHDLNAKKILIVHSFPYALPAYQIIDNSLLKTLFARGIDINNLYFEFLDLARNPGGEYRREVIHFFQKKFESQKIDLIITLHQEALLFTINDLKTLFPDVPIIAVLGSGKTFEHPRGARPIFFLPFSIDAVATAENIIALEPRTGKIFVISGSSALDRRFEERIKNELKTWKGAPVEYIGDLPMNEILAVVRGLPPRSAILYTTIYADKTGKTFMPTDALRMISAAADAPVFGLFETLLGDDGVVGGTMLDHRTEGERAARLAVEILEGKIPEKPLTVLPAPLTPMFDYAELKRWGMNRSRLPAGSVLINKPVSLWQTHRLLIVISLMFFLAQTALIVVLIIQRQRKRLAEKSLRKAEEKYRDIFNNALEGIFETTPEGGPLTVNPTLARILGYDSPEELKSMVKNSGSELWAEPHEREEYISRIEKQGSVLGFRCRLRRKDGTEIWASISARRVTGPDSKTLLHSGFVEDITWRKQSEQEAFDARKELLRMERLSRMGELSASLSHELNQPLMSILSNAGAASMLLEQGKLDPGELKEILHDIIQDDKRAGEIIHGLRSMVKTEEGAVEIVAMDKILHEAVALFNSEAIIRNIKIESEIPEPLPLVKANRVQIEQVMINLMMNGAQAMEANPQANKRLVIGASVIDSMIRVVVRDFGSGIDPSEEKKLFEPFFTTKRSGMGLGLSLSRSIMEAHGGHVWAENNPDKGASFYFDVPIVKEGDTKSSA